MSNVIPTNIITGFLGVGKTTAIRHILRTKPAGETWSVLVNEFGEIGIDGAILDDLENVHVREVPGGCICCVAGLPMKIALNMLIARTRPDRILIEPTGLGHPEEIINTLTGEYYDKVLDLRATLTLLDPRRLSDERYTDNASFVDQLALADVIIANKTDLSTTADRQLFDQWMENEGKDKTGYQWVTQGELDLHWLNMPRQQRLAGKRQQHRSGLSLSPRQGVDLPVALADGEHWLCRTNQGSGFYSAGWLFHQDIVFDFNRLFLWVSGLFVMRFKALLNTEQGRFVFNAENGVLSVNQASGVQDGDVLESRMECIDDKPVDTRALELQILALRRMMP